MIDLIPFGDPLWYSQGAGIYRNPSHVRLQSEVRSYVETNIKPFVAEWERAGEVPEKVRKYHASLGHVAALLSPKKIKRYLEGIRLPGNVSVEDWDSFHQLVCIDEIARCGFLGTIWALGGAGNAIGCPPLVNFGTAEQHRNFLPGIIRGDITFCLGITEPGGSDVARIDTTATLEEDYFVVDGVKQWVTNGMWADYCMAAVRTSDLPGRQGISALIIPLNIVGVSRTPIETSGVASSGCALLRFSRVAVPVNNLIGPLNGGFKIILSSKMRNNRSSFFLAWLADPELIDFNHERLWISANCIGLARVCVSEAYKHASVRQTFGKPLLERQIIRDKFANIGQMIETSYALLESILANAQLASEHSSTAAALDGCTELGGMCALVKVAAARALEHASRESQVILGGLGFTRSDSGQGKVEQIARDHAVLVIGGGSEDILIALALSQEEKDLNARIARR